MLDLFIYGSPEEVFAGFYDSKYLQVIKGDLRDISLVENLISKTDSIIHLACISNDPSFELNPDLGKSINYDSFYPLIKVCKKRINKFIFASSSSVYGIKNETNVTEILSLEPLTDYSKYKAVCEDILLNESGNNFCSTILRPATVCGYSQRTRLDVIVNILTNNAFNKEKLQSMEVNKNDQISILKIWLEHILRFLTNQMKKLRMKYLMLDSKIIL